MEEVGWLPFGPGESGWLPGVWRSAGGERGVGWDKGKCEAGKKGLGGLAIIIR